MNMNDKPKMMFKDEVKPEYCNEDYLRLYGVDFTDPRWSCLGDIKAHSCEVDSAGSLVYSVGGEVSQIFAAPSWQGAWRVKNEL